MSFLMQCLRETTRRLSTSRPRRVGRFRPTGCSRSASAAARAARRREYDQLATSAQNSRRHRHAGIAGHGRRQATSWPSRGMLPLLRGAVVVGHNVRFDLSFSAASPPLRHGAAAALGEGVPVSTPSIAARFGRGRQRPSNAGPRLCVQPTVHTAPPRSPDHRFSLRKRMEPLGRVTCCMRFERGMVGRWE